jgi:hypothetical protein
LIAQYAKAKKPCNHGSQYHRPGKEIAPFHRAPAVGGTPSSETLHVFFAFAL